MPRLHRAVPPRAPMRHGAICAPEAPCSRRRCAWRTTAAAVQSAHLAVAQLCVRCTAAAAVRVMHRRRSQWCSSCSAHGAVRARHRHGSQRCSCGTAQGAVRATHCVATTGESCCTARPAVDGMQPREGLACMMKFDDCLCGRSHCRYNSTTVQRTVDRAVEHEPMTLSLKRWAGMQPVR